MDGERLFRKVGLAVLVWVIACGVGCAAQAKGTAGAKVTTKVTTVVEVFPDAQGQVDWTKGEISAKGIGVRPKGEEDPKARLMAREAAIVVAERNLTKIVHGIHISSDTTVREAVLESDEIERHVEGFIRGATLVRERELKDGSYEVVMTLKMYGRRDSLAASVDLGSRLTEPQTVPDSESKSGPESPAEESAEEPEKPASTDNALASQDPVTGLLVDCRGLGVKRSMSPKIVDDTGQEIWGTVRVDPELVNEKGIVGYYKSVEQVKAMGRVGKNPLVVKATGKSGPRLFPSDPVLSGADAARIIAEDARSHFLDRLAVGFVVD